MNLLNKLSIIAIASAAICIHVDDPATKPASAGGATPPAASQPATVPGRVLAGPIAVAHAAEITRARHPSADKQQSPPVATPPAPSGWKLVACGAAILGFIALRRARYAGG
jgi:hypothetical protein